MGAPFSREKQMDSNEILERLKRLNEAKTSYEDVTVLYQQEMDWFLQQKINLWFNRDTEQWRLATPEDEQSLRLQLQEP